ncbi:MAG TPA: hypothetical protein VH020_13970 [Stellaceae bacterium]|jgi:hypothetical protein|nr:hypothetical protein [Stellaceae bacterium]
MTSLAEPQPSIQAAAGALPMIDADLLATIAALIPAAPDETPDQRRARHERLRALRDEAAAAFAAPRGWRVGRPFTVEALAARKQLSGLPIIWTTRHLDHPYFFRRDRRPVGIVVHLYAVPDCLAAWAQFAGLTSTIVPPACAWYSPGGATPVLYERDDDAPPPPIPDFLGGDAVTVWR